MLLGQSMKGVTKNTGVVDIEVTQGYFSEIDFKIFEPAFRWEVLGVTQVCQGQWISFLAIMRTSKGLHEVAQEQAQRSGAALVCHQGTNAQASVKQLFPVPNNLVRGNLFIQALHLYTGTSDQWSPY